MDDIRDTDPCGNDEDIEQGVGCITALEYRMDDLAAEIKELTEWREEHWHDHHAEHHFAEEDREALLARVQKIEDLLKDLLKLANIALPDSNFRRRMVDGEADTGSPALEAGKQ